MGAQRKKTFRPPNIELNPAWSALDRANVAYIHVVTHHLHTVIPTMERLRNDDRAEREYAEFMQLYARTEREYKNLEAQCPFTLPKAN